MEAREIKNDFYLCPNKLLGMEVIIDCNIILRINAYIEDQLRGYLNLISKKHKIEIKRLEKLVNKNHITVTEELELIRNNNQKFWYHRKTGLVFDYVNKYKCIGYKTDDDVKLNVNVYIRNQLKRIINIISKKHNIEILNKFIKETPEELEMIRYGNRKLWFHEKTGFIFDYRNNNKCIGYKNDDDIIFNL